MIDKGLQDKLAQLSAFKGQQKLQLYIEYLKTGVKLPMDVIRQFDGFWPVAPPHNDQRGFIYSPDDERWAFGGNRSGKTEAGVADCCLFLLGLHPIRSRFVPHESVIAEAPLPPLLKLALWDPESPKIAKLSEADMQKFAYHQKQVKRLTRPAGPVEVWFCCMSWEDSVLDVILPKFKALLPKWSWKGGRWGSSWHSTNRKLTLKNGSTVRFFTANQDVDVFRGKSIDAAYLDEHFLQKYYNEITARLIDRNGYVVGTMTPEAGATWELDHVTEPPDGLTVSYWHWSLFNNPFISEEGKKKVAARIKDPLLRRAKLFGEFVNLSGSVIPTFDKDKCIIPDRELHPDAVRVFGIDLHLKTPSAALWAAWEPNEKHGGFDFVVYRTKKAAYDVDEWKLEIKNLEAGENITAYWGDESERETGVKGIWGQDGIIAAFNSPSDSVPFTIPVKQVNKPAGSFEQGIFKLRDWFKVLAKTDDCRIKIFESCCYRPEYIGGKPAYSLPDELLRYSFKSEHKSDEEQLREHVRKVNDHFIDIVRYLIMIGPMARPRHSETKIIRSSVRTFNRPVQKKRLII